MKDSMYYYGVDDIRSRIQDKKYCEALEYKNELAKELLKKLIKVDFETRDFHRINAVSRAIKFNNALLNEN